jgi:hypothetical protein
MAFKWRKFLENYDPSILIYDVKINFKNKKLFKYKNNYFLT